MVGFEQLRGVKQTLSVGVFKDGADLHGSTAALRLRLVSQTDLISLKDTHSKPAESNQRSELCQSPKQRALIGCRGEKLSLPDYHPTSSSSYKLFEKCSALLSDLFITQTENMRKLSKPPLKTVTNHYCFSSSD